mmetsp:Transcript_133587/g.372416  ORF Transcript_133587/g.372416 Transcript_133587/m.372416 type:complete len:250 (+) Transcript_133587:407-1156(+)
MSVCVSAAQCLLSFLLVSWNFSASRISRSRESSFRRARACFLVGALSSLPIPTQSSLSVSLIFISMKASPIFCASFSAACAVFSATSGCSASVAMRCSIFTSPCRFPASRHATTKSFTFSKPALAPRTAAVATTTALIISATPACFPNFWSAWSSSSATCRPSCGVSLRICASTMSSTAAAVCGPLLASLPAARASFAEDNAACASSLARYIWDAKHMVSASLHFSPSSRKSGCIFVQASIASVTEPAA